MAMIDTATAPGAATRVLDLEALKRGEHFAEPYPHVLALGCLSAEAAEAVRQSFPAVHKPGFHPAEDMERSGAYADLLEDLGSEAVARVLTERLGLDLVGRPFMITVRRTSRPTDGRIHTDSTSKIATILIYLNKTWDAGAGGCLRVLRSGHDFEDYVREVPPVEGAVFAFRRTDASWHGHKPFAGERLVIQLTFLESEEAVAHKKGLGRLQLGLKKLFLKDR